MRKTTSIILMLAFLLVAITGIQMTGGNGEKAGRGAGPGNTYQAEQKGQPAFYPRHAHEWGGYVFILAGMLHLGLNWKPMKSYLGAGKKRKINAPQDEFNC